MAAILVFAAAIVSAHAEAPPSDAHVHFDIPAQSLASALNAYAAATHVQLFVSADLTSGRQSAALKGTFTPEAALQSLLVGTGLVARPIADKGFTLKLRQSALAGTGEGVALSSSNAAPSTAIQYQSYSAALQRALRDVLCRHEETRPGTYRTLIQLWVDESGFVAKSAVLTSTGNETRDAALSNALGDLAIGERPPLGLPQPVTLLLAPGAGPADSHCLPNSLEMRRADAGDGGGAR